MAHVTIVGMTQSGKTALAKRLAGEYRKAGIGVLVCDPLLDSWDCDFLTHDINELIKVAHQNRNCALFVDESSAAVAKHAPIEHEWLATRSRHWGHKCHMIAQQLQQISVVMRNQSTTFYAFKLAVQDAQFLSKMLNDERVLDLCDREWPKLRYYKLSSFEDIKEGIITF